VNNEGSGEGQWMLDGDQAKKLALQFPVENAPVNLAAIQPDFRIESLKPSGLDTHLG